MEAYIIILTLLVILYYLIRPISNNEKRNLEDKSNWRGGF